MDLEDKVHENREYTQDMTILHIYQDLQGILNLYKHYINRTIIPFLGLNPFPNQKSYIQKLD